MSNNPNNGEHVEDKTASQLARDRYRFGGIRCGLRGPARWQSDMIISQNKGLYAFPKDDAQNVGETS